MVEWSMKGQEVSNCNCDFGCPCQFNSLPTRGDCRAYAAMQIDEGRFGNVKLDDLRWIMLLEWPGPVHEGKGTCQVIIDERADETQRDALKRILHGEESEPGSTFIQVFISTMEKILDPVYKPIDFSADQEKRTARLSVPGIMDASVEPIKNPVTGEPSRARIDLPNGFEFTLAEVASGTAKTTGDIKLDLKSSHSHLAQLHLTHKGVGR